MVLHPLIDRRAQFNMGFVVAIALFAFLVIILVVNMLNLVPGIADRTETVSLQSSAVSLNKLLLDGPGNPNDWSTNPTRVGLAKYNSYTGNTVYGELDPVKVDYVSSSLTYSSVKSGLGLGSNTDFRLLITNSTGTRLDLSNFSSIGSLNTVTIHRIVVINNSKYNATLTVWK